MRLKGKTALIAGAGRNNGKAIALTFAREGADLILIARKRGDELNKVAEECVALGVQTLPILGDLGDSQEVNRMVKQGLERFGKVDVLVSVAGTRLQKLPWELSDEEWHQTFAVNLHATFYLARALAPGMIERKSGSIVALGGPTALTAPGPYQAAIVASKHGLHGLIKALAQSFGPYGVRANLLCLAHIENVRENPEWYPHSGGLDDEDAKVRITPLGRLGKPQEVADVAVFLASDESSYITGDRICCNGGSFM